jgi:hypothetical protein
MSRTLRMNLVLMFAVAAISPLKSQWIQTHGPYGGSINAFISSDRTLFAGSLTGGVFRSTDDGVSWTTQNTGLAQTTVSSLAVDSISPGGPRLYSGTYYGAYRSTDGGAGWISVKDGLASLQVLSLAVIPDGVGGTLLFCGDGGAGVFTSSDNGDHWNTANTGLTNKIVFVFAGLPAEGGRTNVYAGTGAGVLSSTIFSGVRWQCW